MIETDTENITRRDFLKFILSSAAVVGLGSTVGRFISPKLEQPTAKLPSTDYMAYLSRLWWIWISAIPADVNPEFDKVGDKAKLGNLHSEKDVFFLPQGFIDDGPTWASPPEKESRPLPIDWVRKATIKADGKSLFFPLNTAIFYEGLDGTLQESAAKANGDVKATTSTILKLKSKSDKISAKRIENVFADAGNPYQVRFSENPTFANFKPNQLVNCVSAGIYCLTTPLKKGNTYDITYGASNDSNGLGGTEWTTQYRFILEVV